VKILFVANRFPYPPFRGDKLKIWNLARRLSKNHELHLITFLEQPDDARHLPELEQHFSKITLVRLPKLHALMQCVKAIPGKQPFQVAYFKSKAFQQTLNLQLNEHAYDAIHVQHLRMSQYFPNPGTLPVVLDLPDAFSLYWQRRRLVPRPWWQRFFDTVEQKRIARYEQVLNRFPLNLVCSVEDLEFLHKEHPKAQLDLLPNGVDSEAFHPKTHEEDSGKRLLFTGNMDYAPNVDAVVHFTQNILPHIRRKHPDVHFTIAGQRPVAAVKALQGPGVSVTGFVPDLADEYARATLVVAPLRFGAGTQNKVLEAFSMAVPVVCTPVGFKGLGIESGNGAVMCETDEAFAAAVLHLLEQPELRHSIGRKGRELVETRFDWNIIAQKLEAFFHKVAKHRRPPAGP
jgi:sugar transferase (PEP-CTERM/EpsH1 system associated)